MDRVEMTDSALEMAPGIMPNPTGGFPPSVPDPTVWAHVRCECGVWTDVPARAIGWIRCQRCDERIAFVGGTP